MVGGALQRQIERHLHAFVPGGRDEVVEILDGAQLRMDRVMAALVAADRPWRTDVIGRCGDAVVAALAVHLADRVDRRQVDHVEAHPRDARQVLGGGGERAVDGIALGVPTAGRSRKHFVPRTEPGQRPIHPHAVLLTARDQFAQRILREHLGNLWRKSGARAGERIPGGTKPRRRVDQGKAVLAWCARRGPLQELRADEQVVRQLSFALAGVQLGGDVLAPRRDRIAPAVDAEGPQPDAAGTLSLIHI